MLYAANTELTVKRKGVNITVIHRDGSACTTLKRVPGSNGKLIDKWVEFYIKQETEKEFYLRNKQVTVQQQLEL